MTGVSIADFSSDVLAPWFSDGDDSWRSNRKTFTSAMNVAAHALWWGLTQSDGKRGRVHILADDAAKVREARDYLDAYAARPMLKGQVKKVAPDGIMTLRNGVTIEVTSNCAKRPPNVLHRLLLTAVPETANLKEYSPRQLAEAVIVAACNSPTANKYVTSILGLKPDWFTDVWERRLQEVSATVREQEAMAAEAMAAEAKPSQLPATSVPTPSLNGLEDGVGADGFYTSTYEDANAQRKMDRAFNGDGRPRVLRRRPWTGWCDRPPSSGPVAMLV